MKTGIPYSELIKIEDSYISVLSSGSAKFLDLLKTVDQSPIFRYLCENFKFAPEQKDFWSGKFRLAAVIYRRMRCFKNHAVTILGESGTGKEIFANAFAVGRQCISVNCTSLPDQLLESELFGHKAGAFTGAVADKQGLLVAAGQGVAFLDEVGDMPPHLQAKLLRVLQERVVRPVGSNIEQPIHCLMVCATNQDMKAKLRNDLYWRLITHVIELPSWRDRVNEVDWAIRCHLDHAQILDKEDREVIVTKMRDSIGNFRELQCLVERAKVQKWLAQI